MTMVKFLMLPAGYAVACYQTTDVNWCCSWLPSFRQMHELDPLGPMSRLGAMHMYDSSGIAKQLPKVFSPQPWLEFAKITLASATIFHNFDWTISYRMERSTRLYAPYQGQRQ